MDKETHYVIPRRDGKVTVMRKPPTTASDDPLDGNEELILELWQQLQSSQSEAVEISDIAELIKNLAKVNNVPVNRIALIYDTDSNEIKVSLLVEGSIVGTFQKVKSKLKDNG